ncbi:MAG: NADPH-dependent FMN reductase [Noviherbaspirillum sp.]
MASKKIAVIVGSPRRESVSRKMALALMAMAPRSLEMEIVDIAQLPFYNQDLEDAGKSPAAWLEFRESVKGFDGVLFVTPEYNRGLPALLKNALDVGSRPYGKSVWNAKPGAIVTVSPGPLGGFGANHSLRQSLVFLNVPCMQQPEAYIGNSAALFDAEGGIANDSTREFLNKVMNAFADWVATHTAG